MPAKNLRELKEQQRILLSPLERQYLWKLYRGFLTAGHNDAWKVLRLNALVRSDTFDLTTKGSRALAQLIEEKKADEQPRIRRIK